MSTKLQFKEDSTQLIEISDQSSIASTSKFKKKNKVDTPPITESPNISASSSSKLSDIFVVQQTGTKKLKPIPRPRTEELKKSSETLDTLDTISSETQSYNKLKSRFLSIRKQAIKSAKVRKKSSATATDTEKQESVINSEISRHEEKRTEFYVQQQDAEDFFCKTETDIKSDRKESLDTFLNIDYENTVVEFLPPDLIDLVTYEKELFQTEKKENPIIIKTDNIEDDGIYQETNSHITKTELLILENRLFGDQYEWFDLKGQLKLLPDPRLDKSYKPFPTQVRHSDFVEKQTNPYFSIQQNTLELIIQEIHFQHHQLFSEEHVIAQQLIHHFDEYKTMMSHDLYQFYRKKLEALRFAKKRLNSSGSSGGDDIKIIRDKMYSEAKTQRQIKIKILNLWKQLKQKRDKQKYSCTGVRLGIHVTKLNYEEENRKWENNIQQEIEEILEEYEIFYETELREYRNKKQQWNNINKQEDDGISSTTVTSELLQEKPKKPKKNYSETQIRNEVIQRFNECLKPPGEPLIEFELNYNHQITSTNEILNTKEKLRRSLLKKTQVLLKILYGNRLICQTKIQPLNDSFRIKFDEFISIKMYNNPDALTIEIYEHVNPINKHKLVAVDVPVPPFCWSLSNSETKRETFKNDDFCQHINDENLFLNGVLMYKIGWDNVCYEQQLFPTVFDIEDLQQWLGKYPDPQDPKNITFFDYIQMVQFTGKNDYFRFDPDLDGLEFCTQQEIDDNLRFKLLKLRNDNDPEFRDVMVPIRDKEISKEMFKQFDERKKEQKIRTDMFGAKFQNEPIDVQRKWANKFLAQIENHVIELSKTAERRICLTDVLNEDVVPTVGSLGSSIINWFQPKRPLRPARKQIKQFTSSGLDLKDSNILCNILGAVHVSGRKNYKDIMGDGINKICVRPFVTVSFRDCCARTTVADGPNPVWNQEIVLPIRNKNEPITISSLQTIKETIKINLYDETVDDLIVDDRLRERNIHQHLGCNWLGSYEIPFHTLLQSNRIEGTFKLNLPTILLGYEQETIRSFHTKDESTQQKIDTFISVFITMQPNINKTEPLLKCVLETIESQYVEEQVTTWHDQYRLMFPKRFFNPFITTMNGEKCCITRYIHPIKLPPLLETEEELAKFVSLIPFRENSALIPDIWLKPQQLLTIMMGSINDHCVLLIGYFLTLGLKCWLLIGYGMPHGYTSYVLVRKKSHQDKHFYLYDVTTGQKHSISHNCPLQRVFCAINDENIWGNIQNDDRLHLIKFSFRKQRDWIPLFCDIISAPTSFDQTEPVYYDRLVDLDDSIERKLKKKIMDLRKHSTTTWNYHSNVEFKKVLIKLQENVTIHDLDEMFPTHQIRGFIHCFPYKSIKHLIDFIHSTGIYLNDHPNLEFSLCCSTKTYCNNVVIVWLYVATLLRVSV